ncbi:MAG TPA: cytochrome c-type biogenesis protein [Burkholderiaceae bacterium]|jgi:cytochrome c-type biogenesis protein CcmH
MDKRIGKFMSGLFVILMLAMPMLSVHGKEAQLLTSDPALEKRVQDLTEQLRCLVCQNQTIADSHADLAIDLKNQVREKMAQGMSDKDILAYMVDRYGDFVLYRPPVKSTTWLLWFGPFLFLIIGIAALMIKLKKRTSSAALSEVEMQRAAALLDNPIDENKTK